MPAARNGRLYAALVIVDMMFWLKWASVFTKPNVKLADGMGRFQFLVWIKPKWHSVYIQPQSSRVWCTMN